MSERPVAAILLAAGKGTRMKSELPKVLHPLLGLPLLAWPIQAVTRLHAAPVAVVIGYGADAVRSSFPHPDLRFVLQEEQLGTGHATLQAAPLLEHFPGDILILPGDAPLIQTETLHRLLNSHQASGAVLTVLTTTLPDALHYGRIVRTASGALERIVEAKDASPTEKALREINSGIYAVRGEFLFAALKEVRSDNAQGEYYLTDIVGIASARGLPLSAFCHPDPAELAGVNDRAELADAEEVLSQRINRTWMKAGVTLQAPRTVRIEPHVTLEADVSIAAQVQLLGQTRVPRGCRIEAGAVLEDVLLGPGCTVGAHAVLRGLELPPRTLVPALTHRVVQGRTQA